VAGHDLSLEFANGHKDESLIVAVGELEARLEPERVAVRFP
jgi:hypothetical protein